MSSESNVRRLPIYILIDCSGSMTGEPMEACRQGLKALLADLRSDPQALETAYLSVIVFGSAAQQVCPLTELVAFQEPALTASGSTALGAALTVLREAIAREVRPSSPVQKGDWRPLAFLLTDGQPTDAWEEPARELRARRLGNLIACAAGPGADTTTLKKITEIVVELQSLEPDKLKAFFKWVSSSVKATSGSLGRNPAEGAPVALPAPPPAITIVP